MLRHCFFSFAVVAVFVCAFLCDKDAYCVICVKCKTSKTDLWWQEVGIVEELVTGRDD